VGATMNEAPEELESFIAHAFDEMMARASGLRERVGEQPNVDGANSVYSLVVHSMGVTRFWLDHVILGNPTDRDREDEFVSSGSLADLEARHAHFRAGLGALVDKARAVDVPRSEYLREYGWFPFTTTGIALHVVEELYQHLGHIDITVDLLQSGD
jgi:hypothetical protein